MMECLPVRGDCSDQLDREKPEKVVDPNVQSTGDDDDDDDERGPKASADEQSDQQVMPKASADEQSDQAPASAHSHDIADMSRECAAQAAIDRDDESESEKSEASGDEGGQRPSRLCRAVHSQCLVRAFGPGWRARIQRVCGWAHPCSRAPLDGNFGPMQL
jgi:hypothetical protein